MSLLATAGGGLRIDRNPGSTVTQLYRSPFAFTGTVFKVTAEFPVRIFKKPEEEQRAAAKRDEPPIGCI